MPLQISITEPWLNQSPVLGGSPTVVESIKEEASSSKLPSTTSVVKGNDYYSLAASIQQKYQSDGVATLQAKSEKPPTQLVHLKRGTALRRDLTKELGLLSASEKAKRDEYSASSLVQQDSPLSTSIDNIENNSQVNTELSPEVVDKPDEHEDDEISFEEIRTEGEPELTLERVDEGAETVGGASAMKDDGLEEKTEKATKHKKVKKKKKKRKGETVTTEKDDVFAKNQTTRKADENEDDRESAAFLAVVGLLVILLFSGVFLVGAELAGVVDYGFGEQLGLVEKKHSNLFSVLSNIVRL